MNIEEYMEKESKMKIGILTHYDVNNQGAQLQLYAMYKKLEEMGHEPVVLTYVKNYDFDREKKLRYQASIKSIPYYIKNYLLKSGIGATYRNYKKLKLNKKFRKENFKFENYATADIDIALIGSDEVFSIPMGVNMMMFGHCISTNKVIAYAPSFGQTDIKLLEKHNAKILVKEGLKSFVDLSARDKNTANIIEKLTERKTTMVCDPVLLYKFNKEKINKKKILSKKYMVIYAYDFNINTPDEIKAIKQYAKEHNLITVSPGTYHKWCDKNISCNALEWVEIFKNAECVVTDTFHGTITSTITNRPMAVLIRDNLNSNKMNDLLEKLGLVSRKLVAISKEQLDKVFSEKIDFSDINKNIEEIRKESEEYLISAIKKCE